MRWLSLTLVASAGACMIPPDAGMPWNVRQLTSGGTHAEAYYSFHGDKLVLMGLRPGDPADQIYEYDFATRVLTRASGGEGKTT